ncbi:19009_t:CDS:2, partial [Racocetra fulgida]
MKSGYLLSISQSYFRYATHHNQVRRLQSIALRREDKSHWERRVALTPDTVSRLIKETGAGAIVQEDISNADVILGIKEVPTNHLIPNKTYMFFSHTHKGQLYNMPMLQDILDKKIRLIDYELMTDAQKRRLVLFGTHAGYAELAKSAVKDIGDAIADDGLPDDFNPMTFVFTGTGNVSNIAPYTSMLIHGSYWDSRYPRLITKDQLREIQENSNNRRLLCIADISCDIEGALEFSHSTTIDDPFFYVDAVKNVEHKKYANIYLYYTYKVLDSDFTFYICIRDEGKGTQIMAVDILPTEIPRE